MALELEIPSSVPRILAIENGLRFDSEVESVLELELGVLKELSEGGLSQILLLLLLLLLQYEFHWESECPWQIFSSVLIIWSFSLTIFFLLASLTILLLISRLMELKDGTLSVVHTLSLIRRSFSSQEKIPGCSSLYWSIFISISGVITFGLPTFLFPGSMEPVSWNLERSLLMQPWVIRSCLLISHGLTPIWASFKTRIRVSLGSGFPLTYAPPSWLVFFKFAGNLVNTTY